MKPMPKDDHYRLYFRPLDCSYTDSFFIYKERYGNAAVFDDMWVDFAAGDAKPEIRVANTYTYFNITNYAYFENITFTGEDLFASLVGDGPTYWGYTEGWTRYSWGPLTFYPMTKCKVREEPTGFFDKLKLDRMTTFPAALRTHLNCSDNWTAIDARPP